MHARAINLEIVDTLVEFKAMRLDEIIKYVTKIEKRKCLGNDLRKFHILEVREIRSKQKRKPRRIYL
jgi:hypothetical protein